MTTKKTTFSLAITLLLMQCTLTVNAAALNATSIGGMWTTTPVTTAASQALTGFRGAFTPMNIGMAVGTYVIISTIGDGVNTLRAQMGSALPAAQLPPVTGWATPETPPATQLTNVTYTYNAVLYGSLELACKAYSDASGLPNGVSVVVVAAPRCNYTRISDGQITTYYQPLVTSACPSGYTASGSSCALTTPAAAQWPSDGIPTLKNNGTAYVPHPRDTTDNIGQPATSSPYTRTGKDAYNNPIKESLTPNVAGGTDYQRDTEGVSPSTGEPMVQRDKFSTDSTGLVLNKSTTQYSNSTISNVNTTNSQTVNPAVDTSSLSKETTSQAILTQLQPGTPTDLTSVDSAVKTVEEQVSTDLTAVPKDLTHNPTQMVTLPSYWNYATGVCYPAEFNMGRFGSVSLDKFCQIYDEHIRSLIVFIFGVFACLHVFTYWKETVISGMST